MAEIADERKSASVEARDERGSTSVEAREERGSASVEARELPSPVIGPMADLPWSAEAAAGVAAPSFRDLKLLETPVGNPGWQVLKNPLKPILPTLLIS
jgi:hypothetical protein